MTYRYALPPFQSIPRSVWNIDFFFLLLLFRIKEHFNSSSSLGFSFSVFLPPVHILFPVSTVCQFYFSISFTSLQQMNSSYSLPCPRVISVRIVRPRGSFPTRAPSQHRNRYQTGYCFLSTPPPPFLHHFLAFVSSLPILPSSKWRLRQDDTVWCVGFWEGVSKDPAKVDEM